MECFVVDDGSRFIPTAKLCRLCGNTDGPFLNVFGENMNLCDKIKNVLPIWVEESDALPHKICYLCSAKVTEFHDFAEKCKQMHAKLCAVIKISPELKPKRQRRMDVPLKDLQVVMTRIEDESEEEDDDEEEEEEKEDNFDKERFTVLNVSGYGPVYTCKGCNALLMQHRLDDHNCGKVAVATEECKQTEHKQTERKQTERKQSERKQTEKASPFVYIPDEAFAWVESPNVSVASDASFRPKGKTAWKRNHRTQYRTRKSTTPSSSNRVSIEVDRSESTVPRMPKNPCFTKRAVVQHLERIKSNLENVFNSKTTSTLDRWRTVIY